MKISRVRTIVMAFACAGLAALAVGFAWFSFSGPDADGAFHPTNVLESRLPPHELVEASKEALTPEQREKMLVDRIVLELQQRYGKTISQMDTQASLLDVQNHIMSMFTADEARAKFHTILRRALPEYADQVIATLNKLEQYQRWLHNNEGLLARMSSIDRKAAMWEKQRELFGEEADEIWSGELLASEARTSAMQDTMAELGASQDTSIEEKLGSFQDALRQTYENSPDAHVLKERFMLAKVFFSLESVQEELKTMPPEHRQFKMDQVRREMGFSEEEIENMQLLDAERERQWGTGLAYMQERDLVLSRYEGAEQENKLKVLREKYFKDEAKTIELEEQDGFLRFNRPRVYGRN